MFKFKTKIRKSVAVLATATGVSIGSLVSLAGTAPSAEASYYETPYVKVSCLSLSWVHFKLPDGSTNNVFPCTTERFQAYQVYNYLGEGGYCANEVTGNRHTEWGPGSGWVTLPNSVRGSGYKLFCKITD